MLQFVNSLVLGEPKSIRGLVKTAGPGSDQPVSVVIDGLPSRCCIARGIRVWRRRAGLECLLNGPIGTGARPHSRFRADPDQLNAWRSPEWNVGFASKRHLHKVAENRCR